MSYYRGSRSNRPPLTPPADLVGRLVSWRPKGADGKRHPQQSGRVLSYDSEARTLAIEVQQQVSMWQNNPTWTVSIPLASGPFTVIT